MTIFPWQTAGIAAITLGIATSPELTAFLTATRENWVQVWPVITGHLCHWTASHLLWDLLVFVIFGSIVERRLERFFLPCLILAGVFVIATVFLLMPQIESYRGLSGIDTFLYTFAVLDLIQRSYRYTAPKLRGILFLPLLLLLGKVAFELATGEALFVSSLGDEAVPLPLAHAAGAVAGLVAWCVRANSESRTSRGS